MRYTRRLSTMDQRPFTEACQFQRFVLIVLTIAVVGRAQVSVAQVEKPKPFIPNELQVWTLELSAVGFGAERRHEALTVNQDGLLTEIRSPSRSETATQERLKNQHLTSQEVSEVFSEARQLFNAYSLEAIRPGRSDDII